MLSVNRISLGWLFSVLTTGIAILTSSGMAAPQDEARIRVQAKQLREQGNWKDALEDFSYVGSESSNEPRHSP